MDDAKLSAVREIHVALGQRGFVRDWSEPTPTYTGILDPQGLHVPVSISLPDLDFVGPPPIRIDPGFEIQKRLLPHVGGNRSLCYFATGAVVFDRYKPAGTVLACLHQAEKVVVDALLGKSDGDFANEFDAYWSENYISVDLPPDYTGMAKIYFYKKASDVGPMTVLCLDDSWLISYNERELGTKVTTEDCIVVQVQEPLTLDPDGEWPPKTVYDLNNWLSVSAPELVGVLEKSFAMITEKVVSVVVRAPNGIFSYRSSIPNLLKRDEFLKSRRHNLPLILNKFSKQMDIERTEGRRADPGYIFSRNLGQASNLSGKRVLLVGCGTIGAYVAHQLAQSGAGADGGELCLADPDKLNTANLGRHLLGVDYLYKNKAEGCAKFILSQLPMLKVAAYPYDARKLLKSAPRFDLIIDATGEEGLSLAINHMAVHGRPKWPPTIFGYLIGNGAIAQAILVDQPDRACLKCLKPELAGPPRFKGLKPGIEVETVANMECGDAQHIPFPVSRSVGAASLIVDLAMEWVGGRVNNRFRNIIFDPERAYAIKDGNPLPSKFCPTCQLT